MRLGRERGAILIQVTLMLVVLLGCAGFAIDSGVMWVARAQAQNAADAAALAAATTFAFDTMTVPSALVVARTGAQAMAAGAKIWGETVAVDIVACEGVSSECPQVPGFPDPTVRQFFSARATVTRPVPVPTYFFNLLGVPAQTVRATAAGTVVPANTANCVWPLAIPDRWNDNPDVPDNKYSQYAYPPGPPAIVVSPDEYIPPTFDGDYSATGYHLQSTTLSPSPGQFAATSLVVVPPEFPYLPWPEIEVGQFVTVQVPGSGGFTGHLTGCSASPVHLGDALSLETGAGASFADVQTGAATLIGRDVDAGWNASKLRVSGGCAARVPTCAAISPRVVTIPVFDPEIYDRTRGGVPEIRIVNFIGFFIESVNGGEIRGHLTTLPGIADSTHPNIAYEWSMMRTAVLTR